MSVLYRIGWGLVFALCVAGSWVTMLQTYKMYTESPVVMSVDTSSYHVSNVPFPAVAVCNVNKMVRSKVWRLAERL